MKQFSFEYTGPTKLAADLARVSDLAKARNIHNIWIQVYVTEEQGGCFLPIRDTIDLCLPEAKYVITHAGKAFASGEITQCAAMIVCNLFEDPSTKLDLMQYPFDEAHFETTIDEIIKYVNENPWIKLISFNAGSDLSGVKFMNRLAENINPDIKITGGAAITFELSVTAQLFSSKGDLSPSALVMTFIGGENFHVRTDVIVGWKAIGKEFTVTKSEGSVLFELDGKPAFDVYKKYLKIEPKPGMIVAQTIEFPLCFEDEGTLFLRCPSILNEDDTMVMMLNDLYVGKKVRLSFGSPEVILNEIAAKLNDIAIFEPQVISVNSCFGRAFFWGESLKSELMGYKKIAPSAGYLTGGELLRTGNRIRIFNETMVTTSMREGEKSADGSGIHTVERSAGDYALTQRLATFIDTITSDLEEYTKTVHRMATTDALTGLLNRREIERIIEEIAADKKVFSVIMLDADNFKQINDSCGHKEGDSVLRLLADSIREVIKATGLEIYASRWGGDEFLLACVSDNEDDSLHFAEELQKKYHSLEAYPNVARTISVGIATATPDEKIEAVYQKADTKLYAAKNNGKACIVR